MDLGIKVGFSSISVYNSSSLSLSEKVDLVESKILQHD